MKCKETVHENIALLTILFSFSIHSGAIMKGYLLLIACLLAVAMFVTLTEGKPIADNKHESEDNADESEEQNVEDSSASGSGSGGGTYKRPILQ